MSDFSAWIQVETIYEVVALLKVQLESSTVQMHCCFLLKYLKCFRSGVGNLFTITGRMNCALSLAGRKIN